MTADDDDSSGCRRRGDLAAEYGQAVVEALDALVSYCEEAAILVGRGREAFQQDVLLQRAAEAIFNRIGDTIRAKLPDSLLDEYPGQPWSTIVAMRVRMAHIYAENDKTIIWNTLTEHVPPLRDYVSHEMLGEP